MHWLKIDFFQDNLTTFKENKNWIDTSKLVLFQNNHWFLCYYNIYATNYILCKDSYTISFKVIKSESTQLFVDNNSNNW